MLSRFKLLWPFFASIMLAFSLKHHFAWVQSQNCCHGCRLKFAISWCLDLMTSSSAFPPSLFYIPFPPLTPGVSPACDPAVVSRVEAGLLARQAGEADEVWGIDVYGSLHQGDVIVQLAVSRVSEILVPVDSLHWENPLHRLWALQLVLPQDDPPAPSILSFTPETPRIVNS